MRYTVQLKLIIVCLKIIVFLMSMMKMIGVAEPIIFISCNLRLPYQASVIKVLEIMRNVIVNRILSIFYKVLMFVSGGRSSLCMLLIAPHIL